MSQVFTLRVKILLGLVLVVAVIFFHDLFRSGKGPPPPSKPPVVKPAPKDTAPQSPVATPQSPARPTSRPWLAGVPDQPWQRDPFAVDPKRLPPGALGLEERPFPSLKVSGIVWGPNGYKALVNDSVVRAGDKVEGARIVRITPKGVVVEKEGQVRFIPLAQEGKLP